MPYTNSRKHPATKVFQALRIEVNQELNELTDALPLLFDALKPQGRLLALTFHSLEDRIVKNFIKEITKLPPDTIPKFIPIRNDRSSRLRPKQILFVIWLLLLKR